MPGLSEQDRRNAYHQSMLRYVGCNADTDLLSAAFGDEIALRKDLVGLDMGDRAELGRVFVQAFKRLYYDLEPAAQQQAIEAGLAQAVSVSRPVLTAHCEVAQRIGERLGLSEEIRRNLGQIYERWDGKGLPRGLSGDDVLPAVRLITLAQDAIALSDAVGIEAMAEVIASRADGPYEADLARLVSANAPALMEGIGATVDRETILALEPDPPVTLDEAACDEAFLAIADMIDMRMPFTHGHSRAVAELAEGAGRQMGLPDPDVRALRWSGCIHDIGELVVPVSTWMRSGPLSVRERDAAQLHAYYGERALASFGREGEPMARTRPAPSRTPRRLGLSSQGRRLRPVAGGADPRRRRGVPDLAGGAPAPQGAVERGGGGAVARRRPRGLHLPRRRRGRARRRRTAVAPGAARGRSPD